MAKWKQYFTKENRKGIIEYQLHLPIYESYIHVIFKQEKKLSQYHNIFTNKDFELTQACVVDVSNGTLAWFKNNDFSMVTDGTLSHEIVHIVDDICVHHALYHSTEPVDNEHIAYLTGYIYKALLTLFKKK